ncbi:hypothetical protein PIB30_087600 [Stylosanthes scabra]|uniref:Uncharacterized protein n=1 Tax=Stylosanthes scabra TaxID=79078 RepID=A0ABU6WVB2_9FABA|nr:hypothetical protein [Stylosanthes scabra]
MGAGLGSAEMGKARRGLRAEVQKLGWLGQDVCRKIRVGLDSVNTPRHGPCMCSPCQGRVTTPRRRVPRLGMGCTCGGKLSWTPRRWVFLVWGGLWVWEGCEVA